jgi:hypothetical protein
LSEVYFYLVYSSFGIWGVSVIIAALFSLSLTLIVSTLHHKAHPLIYLMLVFLVPVIIPSVGIRTQVATFLGLSILFKLFLPYLFGHSQPIKPNRLFFLFPLFILWANLHPGFLFGLIILSFLLAATYLHSPKKSLVLFTQYNLVLITCFLATLINPYGLNLHKFIFQVSSNTFSANHNQDWFPFLLNTLYSPLYRKLLIIIFSVCLFWLRKKILINTLFTALFIATIYSSRYLLPYHTLLAFIVIYLLNLVIQRTKHVSIPPLLKSLTFTLLLLLYFKNIIPTLNITIYGHQSIRHLAEVSVPQLNFPYPVVEYLNRHPDIINIFNHYDWGGFLIWQHPERKYYIDGRMDNFFKHNKSFLSEYLDIVSASPGWETLFNQYPIDAVAGKPAWPLINRLLASGQWQVAYQDSLSILLIKNNTYKSPTTDN